MAKKTIEFYQKTINEYKKSLPSPKIAICGYYGQGNLGDEAILSIIKHKIKKCSQNVQIKVLNSKKPMENISALYKTDLFVFGGGSLLQNSTSNASLFYYLLIIHIANLLCKRKVMLSNGIGPIKRRIFSKRFLDTAIKNTISTFDFISTRDVESQKYLSRLLPKRQIDLIPDPALLYFGNIAPDSITKSKKEYFVYVPCANGIKNNNISIKSLAISLKKAEKLLKIPLAIVVLNPKEDLRLAKFIKKYCPNVQIYCPNSPKKLISLIKKSTVVISQRYHGTLFSSIYGVPTISVSDDPKMISLCNELTLFPAQSIRSIWNFDELENIISSALAHHDQYKNLMIKRISNNSQASNSQIEIILSKFISPS